MKPLRFALLVVPALLFAASPLLAQHKPISPQATINATINGDPLTIVYSRSYTKHPETGEVRKIWGGLVPYGKVWRTGANEATLFTTQQPIDIGGTTIPAGTYSLFTIPEENGGKLIINKQTGQWGTKYEEKQDLARAEMKKAPLDKPVDQFTIAIEKGDGGDGLLNLKWENAQYSVPFTVKK